MSRAGKQAALLLGQVQGGRLVQRGEHDVDIHRATLPSRHILTDAHALIGRHDG
jgi:hypothetical protein